jgi:hypothetical protein
MGMARTEDRSVVVFHRAGAQDDACFMHIDRRNEQPVRLLDCFRVGMGVGFVLQDRDQALLSTTITASPDRP